MNISLLFKCRQRFGIFVELERRYLEIIYVECHVDFGNRLLEKAITLGIADWCKDISWNFPAKQIKQLTRFIIY